MYLIAPILSPVGLAMVAQEWLEDREEKRAQAREEAYLKSPTPGAYFKRAGWRYFDLVEWYGNKTAEDIEERFEGFLRLKNMKAHERVEFCSDPEILKSINEQSYEEIKQRRDYRLMEWALFHKHRDEIKRAYGVKATTQLTEEDKQLNRTLLWIGVIITSLILFIGWLS